MNAGGDTNVLPWVDRTGTILLEKYGNSAKKIPEKRIKE
jgi:hypothetical protein